MSSVQPRFGNASSSMATTVTSHFHPHHEHVSSSFFPNSLKEGAELFEKEFGPVPTSTPPQTKVSTTYSSHPNPSSQIPMSVQTPEGVVRHNAYTTIQPATIQQDAFTTLHPKGTQFPRTSTFSYPMTQQAPPAYSPHNNPIHQQAQQPSSLQNNAIPQQAPPPYTSKIQAQTTTPLSEKNPLLADKTQQLVANIGIDPRHYSNKGYFEKMSGGAVFSQKSIPLVAWPLGVGSVAGLSTATALLAHPAAAGAAGGALIASTGAAIGTGVGAGVLGVILTSWLGYAGYRSKKVMNGYKKSLNNLIAELMKPENENTVVSYLRTKSKTSAKAKARKANAKTLALLNGDHKKSGNAAASPVFKIYMRHARNQNKVFLTRNPDNARRLLAEANRVAAGHIDTI